MRFYIISCLLSFIFYFECLVSADVRNDRYFTDMDRILDVYGRPGVPNTVRQRNIPQLIEFYRRYPNDMRLTANERREFEKLISDYEKSRSVLVDSVPAQGGLISQISANLIARYMYNWFNKKKEDEPRHGSTTTELP
ncbi:hypothetical protein KR009_011318, partial [Drosophila setifemur]